MKKGVVAPMPFILAFTFLNTALGAIFLQK